MTNQTTNLTWARERLDYIQSIRLLNDTYNAVGREWTEANAAEVDSAQDVLNHALEYLRHQMEESRPHLDRLTYGVLEAAIVEVLHPRREIQGDAFATAEEWARIEAEPMEHSDLLADMDALDLLRAILAQYRRY